MWSQAGRCDGEFVVRALGLRAARDYVLDSGGRLNGWMKELGGSTGRGRGEVFFLTDNPAANLVRQ